MEISLPTTEKELELYFMLQRLIRLEKESKKITMQCGPKMEPKYNETAISVFNKAKATYLKKAKELTNGD